MEKMYDFLFPFTNEKDAETFVNHTADEWLYCRKVGTEVEVYSIFEKTALELLEGVQENNLNLLK